MNFNIVKKPKKKDEDDDLLDEDELELNDGDSIDHTDLDDDDDDLEKSADDPKKKMFKFMGIIVAITVGLLLILFIVSLFSSKKYTYEQIESILEKAAISYFKDHPESLPQNDGDIVEIDSSNLVVAGKMKDLSEYTAKGVSCSATVQVEKSGAEYLYVPYLNCGDNYVAVPFSQKIIADNPVVTSRDGLYSSGGNYIFRGENLNNYVELDNGLWRIVKITSTNEIVLVSEKGITYSQPWDDRYNSDRSYSSGINDYSVSRVKEYLDKVYTNPVEKKGENILSSNDKAKLVSYDLCIGKRNKTSESKDNTIECRELIRNQKLGLLTLSDYLYASIDPNCKNSTTKTCTNYNYLSTKYTWWLVTASDENTSSVYMVKRGGVLSVENAMSYGIIRPVIHLNSRVMYKSGNGTLDNPYKLK